MSTCKYCGEEITWCHDGANNVPINTDGSLHKPTCKGGKNSAPANAPEAITGRLESYSAGSATFTLKGGRQKTYALTGSTCNNWKTESYLIPAANHPDIWLEFALDPKNFVLSPKRVSAPAWAATLSDPTAGKISKPTTAPATQPSAAPATKPTETCTSPQATAPQQKTPPPAATTPEGKKDVWNEEREEFCNLLTATGREGIPALLQHLIEKTDFFLAPSSTKYHDACEGGLLHHSLKTYRNLVELAKIYAVEIPEDGTSLIIIALLHDICKTDIYKKERKSLPRRDEKTGEIVLDDWGKKIWDEQFVYTVDDQYPLGHGEKSVIMLQRFIQLTDTEIFAIRWHMMAYDDSRNSYGGNLAITNASDKYRIIPLFHMADLAASFLEIRPAEQGGA